MFNKETEYALRGLIYIQIQNTQGNRPGIAEISRKIDAPAFFIAKILQRLVRNGFLLSAKGKGGGFMFDENKPELLLKNLIEHLQGNEIFTGCGLGLKSCSKDKPCPLHEHYAPIREAINKLVSNETIQTLAKKYTQGDLLQAQ